MKTNKIYIAEFTADESPYLRKLKMIQDKTDRMTTKLDLSFKKIGAGIAAYISGRELLQVANDAMQLATKMQGVSNAFSKLANSKKVLDLLRKSTMGTVNDLQLMQAAVKANNFKLPLDLLAKGLEFANLRAIQTGESVDYMVESFITGVARKSLPILDNLGISQTELNDEIKRTGDFYQAMGRIVDRENGKMQGSIDLTTIKVNQIKAQIDNHETQIGAKLLPLYNKLLEGTSSILNDWTVLGRIFDPYAFTIAHMREELEKINKLSAFMVSPHNYNPYAGFITNTYNKNNTVNDNGSNGDVNSGPNKITIPMLRNRKMDDLQRYLDAVLGNTSLPGFDISSGGISGIPKELTGVVVPELKDTFEEIGSSFVDKFGEINDIATRFGNILGISADTFVGKLISGIDTASQVLSLITSVMSFASGGGPITSLFGLAEGGTVVNNHGKLSYVPIPKFARGGSFTVPPGYSNDSGLIRVQSGERVDVTPSSKVPNITQALDSIKKTLLAGNINNSRRNNQPIQVSIQLDGETIASSVFGYENNFNKRGIDKTQLRAGKGS